MYIASFSISFDPNTANMSVVFTVEKTVSKGVTVLEDFISLTETDFMGRVERDDGRIYKNMKTAINAVKSRLKRKYNVDPFIIKNA